MLGDGVWVTVSLHPKSCSVGFIQANHVFHAINCKSFLNGHFTQGYCHAGKEKPNRCKVHNSLECDCTGITKPAY